MDQTNSLAALMIGCSKTNDDPYHPCEKEEEVVDKSKYLTVVGAFTYLTIRIIQYIKREMLM